MSILPKIVGSFVRGRINRLEVAFAAASAPFHAEIKSVQRSADAHQKLVDAGSAVWEQVGEDGEVYDYGSELGERIDDANDALSTLRKAFAFLIYHQWERSTQRWTSAKAPNHQDLIVGAKAAGIALDEPGLETLRLLVNTLKHNSAKCGPDLYIRRLDLFKSSFDPTAPHPVTGKPWTLIDWAEHITLTDDNIDEFFAVISNSIPR
jgi:hypothetical protein